VAEWVIDAYQPPGYSKLDAKDSVDWKAAIIWPKKIFPCIVRGGHWEAEATGCRSASRLASETKWQERDPQIPKSVWWYTDAFHVGFRVLRPLTEPDEALKLRFWDGEIKDIHEILDEGGKQARVPLKSKASK